MFQTHIMLFRVLLVFLAFLGSLQDQESNIISNCSCVLYHQCNPEGFIITNGETLIDIRVGGPNEGEEKRNKNVIVCEGGTYRGEYVCCRHRSSKEIILPAVTSTTARVFVTKIRRLPTKSHRIIQCGRALPTVDIRILSDDELTPLNGEFPWLAAIYRKSKGRYRWSYHKAGSLIHPKVLLTGSHVVGRSEPNELKVVVNGQIKLSEIGADEGLERNVIRIVKHPEFSSGTLYNDVALLILEEAYNSTAVPINTICLRREAPQDNKRCLVAGWGQSSRYGTSKLLRKVAVPVRSRVECQQMLRKTRLGSDYVLHESFLCAGGEEGKDACNGDGGSPLVCPSETDGTMYQAGLVAFGIECGLKDVPGVYADVAHFHSWIVDKLKEYDINI